MELTGAALRRSLPSPSPAVARERRRPARVACARAGFAEEGHLRYYEAGPPPRKAAVEAVARDLARIRAMGLVAGDAAKEKVLLEAADLLLQELNQITDDKYSMKKAHKEEKADMKALKKQQKEAKKAAAMMMCEDESSSESSESDCEEEQVMRIGQGMAAEVRVSGVSTVTATECDKAAKKAMKKMEKEQKKAAKKAMKKMKKEAKKKMAMATLNGCMDEDSSSCSSESSESECEGEVLRMSRCATIIAPQQPAPTTAFPIIVPQIPESVSPGTLQEPHRTSSTGIAVVDKPMASRIEVCMGGKCKKSGALALLQEFEKKVGVSGAAVGCKCLGMCGLGPNVRLRSEVSADGAVKKNPLYIGVGLEDVGTIVAGLSGDGDLGVAPA